MIENMEMPKRKTTVVDYVGFKNNDLSALSSEDTVVEYAHERYEVTTIMHKNSVEVYRRRLDTEEATK